jgi:osmotically-inducible protein OsmY
MKTDEQLKHDVIEELQREPRVTSCNIIVATREGVVALSGTVPHYAEKRAAAEAAQSVEGVKAVSDDLEVYLTGVHDRKDSEIEQAVVNSLKWHVWVPSHVQATVENGWVTLTGCVAWEFERNSAADAVRFLSGVKGVSNEITLDPHDQSVAVKEVIEEALRRYVETNGAHIGVSTYGGKVILAGRVGSENEREMAGSAAWSAPGVTEVENNLSISF